MEFKYAVKDCFGNTFDKWLYINDLRQLYKEISFYGDEDILDMTEALLVARIRNCGFYLEKFPEYKKKIPYHSLKLSYEKVMLEYN